MTAGTSPKDACSHGHVGYCGSCWAEQAPKCRHGHPGACGFCIEGTEPALLDGADEAIRAAVGRELELASARERLSKLTGLHPDRKLADHLDALATRPGHEEVRRERVELRATLVEALGPLPTDHPHMLGQLRVKLAKALSYRDRCPVAAEDVEAAGVTLAKLTAWADALGWSRDEHSERHGDEYVYGPEGSIDIKLSLVQQRGASWVVATFIRHAAEDLGRPAFDILDEMAAQEAP